VTQAPRSSSPGGAAELQQHPRKCVLLAYHLLLWGVSDFKGSVLLCTQRASCAHQAAFSVVPLRAHGRLGVLGAGSHSMCYRMGFWYTRHSVPRHVDHLRDQLPSTSSGSGRTSAATTTNHQDKDTHPTLSPSPGPGEQLAGLARNDPKKHMIPAGCYSLGGVEWSLRDDGDSKLTIPDLLVIGLPGLAVGAHGSRRPHKVPPGPDEPVELQQQLPPRGARARGSARSARCRTRWPGTAASWSP